MLYLFCRLSQTDTRVCLCGIYNSNFTVKIITVHDDEFTSTYYQNCVIKIINIDKMSMTVSKIKNENDQLTTV